MTALPHTSMDPQLGKHQWEGPCHTTGNAVQQLVVGDNKLIPIVESRSLILIILHTTTNPPFLNGDRTQRASHTPPWVHNMSSLFLPLQWHFPVSLLPVALPLPGSSFTWACASEVPAGFEVPCPVSSKKDMILCVWLNCVLWQIANQCLLRKTQPMSNCLFCLSQFHSFIISALLEGFEGCPIPCFGSQITILWVSKLSHCFLAVCSCCHGWGIYEGRRWCCLGKQTFQNHVHSKLYNARLMLDHLTFW